MCQEAKFLGNPDKSLKNFPPCYSQSSLQLCLEISISSNSRNLLQFLEFRLLYAVKEKGGKPDRKPYPLLDGLGKPYRNLKSDNSPYYAQKPQRNCALMNSASGRGGGGLVMQDIEATRKPGPLTCLIACRY
jgi:hypothetical protein